jgi:hypothetical protein
MYSFVKNIYATQHQIHEASPLLQEERINCFKNRQEITNESPASVPLAVL